MKSEKTGDLTGFEKATTKNIRNIKLSATACGLGHARLFSQKGDGKKR